MNETTYKEIERTIEWNCGYNTAMVIIKGINYDEAVRVQSKLHDMGKSDPFITGYTNAVIAWSTVPF